jgi:hypothetical protein
VSAAVTDCEIKVRCCRIASDRLALKYTPTYSYVLVVLIIVREFRSQRDTVSVWFEPHILIFCLGQKDFTGLMPECVLKSLVTLQGEVPKELTLNLVTLYGGSSGELM